MPTAAEIRKVITSGTTHQRAILLANDIGLWLTPDEPAALTEEEFRALDDSFRTELERKTYRKFKKLDELMRFRLIGLSQIRMEYELVATKIFFFDYSKSQLDHLEDLLADMTFLVSEECGEEKQIAIWKKLTKDTYSFPIGSEPKLEIEKAEGKKYALIKFKGGDFPKNAKDIIPIHDLEAARRKRREALKNGDKTSEKVEFSYDTVILECGGKLSRLRTVAKTFINTLRKIMQENSFHVRPYKKFLDNIEVLIRIEPKLSGLLDSETGQSLIDSAENQKQKDKFKKMLEKDLEIRRYFWKPYDETELDPTLEKMLLEEFNHKAIDG